MVQELRPLGIRRCRAVSREMARWPIAALIKDRGALTAGDLVFFASGS